jgi:hypothetical protein
MTPRPKSLREVAHFSDSLAAFGRNMRDWLHEIRGFSSRPQVALSIREEPQWLRDRFPEGSVADSWLAAYAEHVSSQIGLSPPDWAFHASRISDLPWFSDAGASPGLRWLALARSPLAFKRRNLYTTGVELDLRLRAGRPAKSAAEKRASNAKRQRRFRARLKEELIRLRILDSKLGGRVRTPVASRR